MISEQAEKVEIDEGLWRVADVVAYLKMSESWVYQAAARGALPCIHIGAVLRFQPEEIRAWVRGEQDVKVVRLPGCRS